MTDWHGYGLIVDGPTPAADNMPRDEALLTAFRAGDVGPTWRLYTWRETAVTYGRSQRAPAFGDEVPAFPRVSGGGLVPHGSDFTYCVVRERRCGAANYEDIVDAVAQALRKLGVPAAVWRDGPRGKDGYCFASLAPFDLHVGGRKVAGCAQRRLRDAVLHHGSIAAAPAPEAIRRRGLVDEARTVTLQGILGRPVTLAAFARALAEVTGLTPRDAN